VAEEFAMSKLRCSCGFVISDVVVPNEVTGHILSDKSADAFTDALCDVVDELVAASIAGTLHEVRSKYFAEPYPRDCTAREMANDILYPRLLELSLSILECDQCGRLWIQDAPDRNTYRPYESEESRGKVLGLNDARQVSSKQGRPTDR
jgi:hypothetical protein